MLEASWKRATDAVEGRMSSLAPSVDDWTWGTRSPDVRMIELVYTEKSISLRPAP